jgi:hypothetical protein
LYKIFYLSTLNTTGKIYGAEDDDHFEVTTAIIIVCHGVPVICFFLTCIFITSWDKTECRH